MLPLQNPALYSLPDALSQWTIPNVANLRLQASADKVFVREAVSSRQETYGQFMRHAKALASHFLHAGVQPEDAVLIFAANSIAALHAWMATAWLGAMDVSVNTGYRGQPLRHVFELAKPKLIVCDAELMPYIAELSADFFGVPHVVVIPEAREQAAPLDTLQAQHPALRILDYAQLIASPAPDAPPAWPAVRVHSPASVVFTSGTTGPAKGVVMPHGHVCLLAYTTAQATHMTAADVFYSAHPLFHIAGKFMGVFATFMTGGELVLDRKFDAGQWLGRIRSSGATLSIAHGPMIEMIHAQPEAHDDADNPLTRLMCCPLPKRRGQEFQSRFNVTGIEMWGMSEVGCPIWTRPQEKDGLGSCGQVLTDWYHVELVDPQTDFPVPVGEAGEIVVRPKYPWTTMLGYLGMPQATLDAWRNLWFHTGDIAIRDAGGNVFYVDRKDDRIRRRSENISSYDIESATADFPGVQECAAVGVETEYENDDDILVYVVPCAQAQIDPAQLLAFLARRLPHFMVPRYIELIDALPRTPTNKVRKKQLKQRGIGGNTWDRKRAGIQLKTLTRHTRAGKAD